MDKLCNKCRKIKSLSEFYTQEKTRANGEKYIYYRPDCIECTKSSTRKWSNENKERHRINTLKYKNSKKGKMKNYIQEKEYRENGKRNEWRENNKDKLNEYVVNRMKNKKHKINNEEWEDCKQYFNNSCAYCGIDEHEAKEIYNNYLHKEHVIHNGANDLSNCIPACKGCNSSKHDSDFNNWYNEENENYTYERLEKIHTWLNEDYLKYING